MIVVSDTSPLNYLVIIGQVDILPALFGRVIAPPAVIGEMLHPDAPPSVRLWAAAPPDWLEVISPTTVYQALRLDQGEVAALSLAKELHANLLLLDDRKALAIARRFGFTVTGTIGVLGLAARRQLIDVSEVVAALRKTNFRCSAHLLDELLRRDRERRGNTEQ